MIDIHCHMIPNIDDGSQSPEISLQMAHIAVANGTRCMAATPHAIEGDWLPSWQAIKEGCQELQQRVAAEGLNLSIVPGAEVAVHLELLEKMLAPGPYCINEKQYMLVELPASHIPQFAEDFLFTLQTRGIRPILAHPERNPEIRKNPDILVEWVRKGVLMQVNGTSLAGKMGPKAMETAELLLRNEMVHCIGSDAHGVNTRSPNLTNVKKKIIAMVGKNQADQILITNPQKIIAGQELIPEVVDRIQANKKQSLLARVVSYFR